MNKGLVVFALGAMFAVTASVLSKMVPAEDNKPEQTQNVLPNYYFPNTEPLGAQEFRVVALGTGSPALRKAQASTSWLIELGNGDKFLFDVGTGSQMNFVSLEVPYGDITALFLSHLHSDHAGDMPAMWINSWLGGRLTPFPIYGPSGPVPELGTAYFIEHLQKMMTWDVTSRHGKLPTAGAELEVHEFDHTETGVIYENNGVTIRSWPAIHILDGPVSFRIDWNGLSFVFSGDTAPNKWFVENAQNADLLVHESFVTVSQMVNKMGWDRKTATFVGTVAHTSPAAAGRIFSMTRPRLAVGYHFYNDFETGPESMAEVRKTYDGPVVLAQDMMVFNVSPENITVRIANAPELTWPRIKDREAWLKAPRRESTPLADWYREGVLTFR